MAADAARGASIRVLNLVSAALTVLSISLLGLGSSLLSVSDIRIPVIISGRLRFPNRRVTQLIIRRGKRSTVEIILLKVVQRDTSLFPAEEYCLNSRASRGPVRPFVSVDAKDIHSDKKRWWNSDEPCTCEW